GPEPQPRHACRPDAPARTHCFPRQQAQRGHTPAEDVRRNVPSHGVGEPMTIVRTGGIGMRRLRSAFWGTALAVTALLVPAAAATAATPTTHVASTQASMAAAVPTTTQPGGVAPDALSDCPDHSLCLWNDSGFDPLGGRWVYTVNNPYAYNTWYFVGLAAN